MTGRWLNDVWQSRMFIVRIPIAQQLQLLGHQLKLAGERSIPITVVVLLLVFGALVAVGVPLLGSMQLGRRTL